MTGRAIPLAVLLALAGPAAAGADQAAVPARILCDDAGRCLETGAVDEGSRALADPYVGPVDRSGDIGVRAFGGYERDQPDGAPLPPSPPRDFDGPFYRR